MAPLSSKHPLYIQGFRKSGGWAEVVVMVGGGVCADQLYAIMLWNEIVEVICFMTPNAGLGDNFM